ncbi:MAG: four helix bundle protein [Bacteroidales bacterium]
MENKEFGLYLEKRTKMFAIDIIQLCSVIPYSVESKVIRNQLTKSATSIGANYREANRSRSKADFISKIKICESESNETVYWLEILSEMNWINYEKAEINLKEANELLALFTSISNSSKHK